MDQRDAGWGVSGVLSGHRNIEREIYQYILCSAGTS